MRVQTVLWLVCVTTFSTLTSADSPPNERPNVIVILTDDQGVGDVGVNGNDRIRTPHLDRFARDGIRLTRFYCQPLCSPTRAGLMTGRYHYRTGVIHTSRGGAKMHTDEVTIAELLKQSGYATGLFGKWHLGNNYPLRPQDQGFDEVLVHRSGAPGQPPDHGNGYFDTLLWHNGQQVRASGYCGKALTDGAIRFIEKNRQRPFFLFLSSSAPHTPLEVEERWVQPYRDMGLDESTARVYGMLENLDRDLGRLLHKLEDLELRENTLIVFLSDNGPAERRYNAGLRGVKTSTYEGGIRVPCFLQWPQVLRGGRQESALSAHVDLLPTLLEACRVDLPPGMRLDGVSLLPLLRNRVTALTAERAVFIQCHRGLAPQPYVNSAVVTQDFKLVMNAGTFGRRTAISSVQSEFELYDLSRDPAEEHDLSRTQPEVVVRLKGEYERWFLEMEKTRGFKPGVIRLGEAAETITLLSRYQDGTYEGGFSQGWLSTVEQGSYEFRVKRGDLVAATEIFVSWQGTVDKRAIARGGSAVFELASGEGLLDAWAQIEGEPRQKHGNPSSTGDIWVRRLNGQRRQNFSTDPKWDGFRHRLLPERPPLVRQDFGYSRTQHAGGKKTGEIGGWIQRSLDPARYFMPVDKTLEDPLHVSGKFSVTRDNGSTGALIGWFNRDSRGWRTPNSLAMRLDGNLDKYWVFFEYGTNDWATGGIGAFEGERYQTTPTKPFKADGTVHSWSLDYDPVAGSAGRVVVRVDDRLYSLDVKEQHRRAGATFDCFGIWCQEATGSGMELWFDDLVVDGQRLEFDEDPGWVEQANRVEYSARYLRPLHDFGYSLTALAGGEVGEIGGVVWRDEKPSYYGDVVERLSLADRLHASGKVTLTAGNADSAVFVGWFNSRSKSTNQIPDYEQAQPDSLAVLIEGPSRVGHYFRPTYSTTDRTRHLKESGPLIRPDGAPHTWSLDYDPQGAGGRGEITVRFDDHVQTMLLAEGIKAKGATFDRFGLFNAQAGGWHVMPYFDDLNYTAIPNDLIATPIDRQSADPDSAGTSGFVGWEDGPRRVENPAGGGVHPAASPYEPSVVALTDGRLLMVFGGQHGEGGGRTLPTKRKMISADSGRTWSEPVELIHVDGKKVNAGGRQITLLRLKSGRLGCVATEAFLRSEDEGETWSQPFSVTSPPPNGRFVVRNDSAVVLRSGRVVVPGVRYGFEPPRAEEGVPLYSDDEGETWLAGSTLFVDSDKAQNDPDFGWDEWNLIELKDGRLLALVRTTFGCFFQAHSRDQGESWSRPVPTDLPADQAPCLLRRLPNSGNLLVFWTQASVDERERFLTRHRLSCAISRDDGVTWEKFKNLESLDGVSRVSPPTAIRVVKPNVEKYPQAAHGYHQPLNRERYYKAPGVLRCAYPTCAFIGDHAVITYGYGSKHDSIGYVACKIRILPQAWFEH